MSEEPEPPESAPTLDSGGPESAGRASGDGAAADGDEGGVAGEASGEGTTTDGDEAGVAGEATDDGTTTDSDDETGAAGGTGVRGEAESTADERGSIRVLHVDDDETIRRLVDRYLAEHGLEVVSESTPAAAADRLRTTAVDCVVSDYDMPGSDGLDFLETVRERHPDLPFVLFTGKGSEEIASEAIGAGVTDYIQKRGGQETYEMLANRIENAVSRYRAERARERSERRFDTLFETVPDAVLDLDAEGVIRAANPAVRSVLGRDPDALIGEHVTDLLPQEDRATYAERFADYVETGERALAWTDTVVDAEVDGERRPVSVSLGERTVAGERRVTAVVRDVTERKQREQRLREARERYRRLVEASVVGIYTVRDHTFEYVDPYMADLLGYEQSELVGEDVMTVIPETERERVETSLRVGRSGEPESVNYTLTMERRDGEQIVVKGEGARVETGEDEPLVVGAIRDVTERERARRKLRESRDRIEALHDAAVGVAAATSVEAVAERAVAAADEILDMDHSLVGVREGDSLPAVAVSDAVGSEEYYGSVAVDDTDRLAAETYRRGESMLIDDLETTGQDPATEEYRSAVSVPLGDRGVFQAAACEPDAFDERDLRAAELLAAHVTSALERLDSRERLREQKRRLEAQNERLETFASVVSHDLRNPIEVARANLELAERGDTDAIPEAERALDRMSEIVDDVLELARGPDTVETMPVALVPVVEAAWSNVHGADATLSVEVDDGTAIAADRGQLKRLLENLLSNVVEHASTDDTVTVRVGVIEDGEDGEGPEGEPTDGDQGGLVGFYVADDGDGVAPELQGEVFEPGVTEGNDGTGLGLAIVTGIADAHGWSISLTDSRDGGARVEVTGVEPA